MLEHSAAEVRAKYHDKIPERTLDALIRWGEGPSYPPGQFVIAVLENDLMQAFGRADPENAAAMPEICKLIYNELPAIAHGSPARVRAWQDLYTQPSETT